MNIRSNSDIISIKPSHTEESSYFVYNCHKTHFQRDIFNSNLAGNDYEVFL